jgi:hypothetical protein
VAATAANVTSSLASSPDIHARERIPIINVFHPNDPVASRLEPLLDPSAALIPPAHCTQSNSGFNNSSITGEGEIMKLMAHVRSLTLQRMHGINWADILAAGQFSSARLM